VEGPQQTLYIPGCWLNDGENEIIVFEQEGFDKPEIEIIDTPILSK
jgi:beta-galactosidase